MKQNIRQWLIIILNEQTFLLIFIPLLVIFLKYLISLPVVEGS